MDHKLNIKFGEVNNLGAARYAAAAGASLMGFNLSASSPRHITEQSLKEISGWAPGPALVAEWENESADEIMATCNKLDIEYVQLNCFNPEVTAALKHDFCVIQNIDIHADAHTSALVEKVNQVNGLVLYYMLSFKTLGDQEAFLAKPGNELLITDLCRNQPVLLNFHFNKSNVVPLVEQFKPFGINLKGESESAPGLQDFSGLSEILDLVDTDAE